MKKIVLTPKAKRIALLAVIFLVCGGILAVVLNNANAQVQTSNASRSSKVLSSNAPEISISSINSEDSISHTVSGTESSSTFDPEKESSLSEPLTTSSKSTSVPPKPIVEGDSINGSQPTNSTLTDKNHKPTYTSQPTVTTETGSSKSSNTSSGEKSSQGYDPIFGYSHGTGGEMSTVGNSDDELTGNKVGIME